MKKVLFVNHTRTIGGAETIMLQIISNVFAGHHEKVFIAEPAGKGVSLLRKTLYGMGITHCYSLPYKCLGNSLIRSIIVLLFNIYSTLILTYRVKKESIDIVYSNTSISCIGIVAAILARKPHIWHFHEPVSSYYGWTKSLRILYAIFLRYKKNTVIFISENQKTQWQAQLPKSFGQSKVIYNYINEINTADKPSRSEVVFGYLGGIEKRKNVVFLVETFHELACTYPNVRLTIGGSGSYEDVIKKVIASHSLESFVNIMGYVSDRYSFYRDIDVFVLPSLSESWGLVSLEAMLARKAVIMTNNSGLHEILENKQDCIFFDPTSKRELLGAMKTLMDEKYRATLAKRGHEKIKQYNFNMEFKKSFNELFT
jgi:glycosyltransferase involved in cell wall biosynthesis